VVIGCAACAPATGGWDVRRVEQGHPSAVLPAGHRLGDLAPHFWIADDELVRFACRWSRERAVPVSVHGATPEEFRLLGLALGALEVAVDGLRFELGTAAARERGIAVAFEAATAAGDPSTAGSGDAIADCRVRDVFAGTRSGERLGAQLEEASVRIRRSRLDLLGRLVPLDELELLATLLHELGHAMGYSSHTRGGRTVMRLAPSEVRLQARAVLRGGPLRDDTLAALYALPSGTVLGRDALGAEAAATARVFAELAARSGWGQPLSRAGQDSAELWWRDHSGERIVLRASRLGGPWPEGFALRANAAARSALRKRVVPR